MIDTLLFTLLFLPFATPLSGRAACQAPTSPALLSCAPGTLYVSATDLAANFTSLQSAILSLPSDNSSHTILIGAGIYTEQVNVTRPGPVTLLGQTNSSTTKESNTVKFLWQSANHDAIFTDNAFTSVLTVAPNLNASLTGSGPTGFPVPDDTPFGNIDFRSYNIDWSNEFVDFADGPSLAVSLGYSNNGFYYNRFFSYQDTVYVGKLANAYFYENEIAGQTDFLYGFGTAFITQSNLTLRSCGGGITAWKGTNTTFTNKYGVYITSSTVNKANSSLSIKEKCFLGRPWNSQHRSIFLDTFLDDSIAPSGYSDWIDNGVSRTNNLTMMMESGSFGPGKNDTGRLFAGLTHLLTSEQAAPWSNFEELFQRPDGAFDSSWVDRDL